MGWLQLPGTPKTGMTLPALGSLGPSASAWMRVEKSSRSGPGQGSRVAPVPYGPITAPPAWTAAHWAPEPDTSVLATLCGGWH